MGPEKHDIEVVFVRRGALASGLGSAVQALE